MTAVAPYPPTNEVGEADLMVVGLYGAARSVGFWVKWQLVHKRRFLPYRGWWGRYYPPPCTRPRLVRLSGYVQSKAP